jgi:fucose 4-O-acetylase-like acetyltransferase
VVEVQTIATPAPRAQRAEWMDAMRGAAIFLVVFWHASGILILFGYEVPRWLVVLNETFSSYRMPILMTLSGMLLASSLAKPLPGYAWGKIANILWPFLLWLTINYAVIGYDVPIWSREVWAKSYLWFLYYLLVFYALAPLLRAVPTWLLVVLPWLATMLPIGEDSRRFLFLAGFFFFGRWISEHRGVVERVLASRRLWLLAPVVVPFSIAFAAFGPWRYYGVLAPFSAAGILLGIAVARMPGVARRTDALRFVGRNSIVYYVSHFPVTVGVVALAGRAGLDSSWTVLLGFVVALGVGTALAHARRFRAPELLFGLPKLTMPRALDRGGERLVGLLSRPVLGRSIGMAALAVLLLVGLRLT